MKTASKRRAALRALFAGSGLAPGALAEPSGLPSRTNSEHRVDG